MNDEITMIEWLQDLHEIAGGYLGVTPGTLGKW
jgi:hypothetical protein